MAISGSERSTPVTVDNAAQLDQFLLSYHKTTGSSIIIDLLETLIKNAASGRVCVSNLEKETFYDFRYSVDVSLTSISVTPPGDFPKDITHRISSNCSVSKMPCKCECLSVCTCLICTNVMLLLFLLLFVCPAFTATKSPGAAATATFCFVTMVTAVMGAFAFQTA